MKQSILIKWFPPSWFQIKSGTLIICVDPAYLSTNFAHYSKRIEYSKWPDPIDGLPEKLEKADIILVTHHHKDHCKKVTVNRLKKRNTTILATRPCTKELGKEITIVKPGVEITIDDTRISATEAYNLKSEEKGKLMHKKGNGVGYVITIKSKRIYHAGDTDLILEMEYLENIDIALLPIDTKDFTMGLADAVEAAEIINPKVVVPMHRFQSSAKEYKQMLESRTSIKVEPLDIGEPLSL
jgi:L-ascorbate metabolism protein UlaG (beta-lactamase superfamily)